MVAWVWTAAPGLAALIAIENGLGGAQGAGGAVLRHGLVEHEVHAERKHLPGFFLAVDNNHGERGSGSAGSMAIFEQRGDVGRVGAIKDQQVEAILRQAYAGAHRVGAQLHFNREFVQDVAEDFHGSFVRAH